MLFRQQYEGIIYRKPYLSWLCSPIVLLDPVALRRVGRRLNRTFHQERLEQPRCCGAVPFSTDFRR